MLLTRHSTRTGPRWAADGSWLPAGFSLSQWLALPAHAALAELERLALEGHAEGPLLAPLEPEHEVWASGVTYLRSRQAREAESSVADVYERVYAAERPELFFKSLGFRVRGMGQPIRVRADSRWNVPEPELTLLLNAHGEILGYTAGNDVSSRDIEGENPLYLPQAKVFNGSCALGPGLQLLAPQQLTQLSISLEIVRQGEVVFAGQTKVSQMKRQLPELASFLMRELAFPHGVLLMTGTGIVPGDDFTLTSGDTVNIRVGDLSLTNPVGTE